MDRFRLSVLDVSVVSTNFEPVTIEPAPFIFWGGGVVVRFSTSPLRKFPDVFNGRLGLNCESVRKDLLNKLICYQNLFVCPFQIVKMFVYCTAM